MISSPGIIKYREELSAADIVPLGKFSSIAKDLVNQCNSNAYVFVNQPGLRKQDFTIYKKEFISLQTYIFSSSTALDLGRIEVPSNDTFGELIDYTSEKCNIDKFISLDGNNTDSFEPYIDTATRVIRIDYPKLPEEKELRSQIIAKHDKFLRSVLAQIPSPAQTIVYTALEPGEPVIYGAPVDNSPIFPEIFRDPSKLNEVEKNNHDLGIPPQFNKPRAKFQKTEPAYVSLFDSQFITENYDLLRLILSSLVGFLVLQLVFHKSKPAVERPEQSPRSSKKPTEPTNAKSPVVSASSSTVDNKAGKRSVESS